MLVAAGVANVPAVIDRAMVLNWPGHRRDVRTELETAKWGFFCAASATLCNRLGYRVGGFAVTRILASPRSRSRSDF